MALENNFLESICTPSMLNPNNSHSRGRGLRMHNHLYYGGDPTPSEFFPVAADPYLQQLQNSLLDYNEYSPAAAGNGFDPLSLEFSGLSLGGSQENNMQRMRIQSAARATQPPPPQHPTYGGPSSSNGVYAIPPYNSSSPSSSNGVYAIPPYNSSSRRLDPPGFLNGGNSRRLNEAIDYINLSQQRELVDLLYSNYNHQYRNNLQQPPDENRFFPTRASSMTARVRPRPNFALASLQEMRGKILSVAKDQYGCRFLQGKFEEGNPDDIQMIFVEIKDHICGLMVHQFGNYLIQKFLEVCNIEQTTQVLLMLINDEHKFTEICVDMYGTRVVQSLIEHLTTPEQTGRMIAALRRITVALTKSMNGHHVIQHCLKYLTIEDNQHILDVVADNCLDIATDKSGCCVLQQCLEHAHGEPRQRLIAELTSNALLLSQHPFGNYVVQYILGLRIPQATADILGELKGSYIGLCMDKYGSNVVEKCLKESEEYQRIVIIEEIIYSSCFLRVLQDPYGNYVAQKALDTCKGALLVAMTQKINSNAPNLHSHPHGKRVLERTLRVSRPGIAFNM